MKVMTKIVTDSLLKKEEEKSIKSVFGFNRLIFTLLHYKVKHPVFLCTFSGSTIEILVQYSYTLLSVFIVHFVHVFVH